MKKKKTQRARKRLVLSLMLIALAITAWGREDVTATIDGVNVTVTVLEGWNVDNIDKVEGTSGDFNRPFELKKDNYYYFGKATVGEYAIRTVLWEKFENVKLTIDGNEVTGVVLRFKGIDGYYRIRKVSELTKRDGTDDAKFDNTTFLRVVPLKDDFATNSSISWESLKNSERTAKFQDRDEAFPNFSKDNKSEDSRWGYGCLYIAGGPGFGYGEYDKYVGWDKRWMPDGYNQNYTLIDNQMWIPSPEKNLYKFRLQAGGNISNDPNKAFNVKFYLNNYMKKFTGTNYGDEAKDWTKYNLENSWRGEKGTHNGTPVESYPYLMHLKDGRDCFYISGNVPGTENDEQQNSPDWNNGNFRTTTIGFDSDMPSMPEGYTFEITLDLREKKPAEWGAVIDGKNGIEVDIEQVKHRDDAMYKYVNPAYMKIINEKKDAIEQIGYDDDKKMVELYLGYYGHKEEAKPATKQRKRIKLRDALRLDYGIRYANQYNKDGNLNGIKKYDKMIIHGILSVDDMEYISWLCNYNLLTELDLSDAVLPGNIIPAPSAIDGINSKSGVPFDFGGASTSLTKVIMPANGVSGIGKNAFKGCTELVNVAEIVKNTKGYIGESAFEGCTNEKFTKLDVPETITEIGSRAFANDKQLTEVTVPASMKIEESPKPTGVGTEFDNKVPNIPTDIINAIDFNNGGEGVGFHHTSREGEPVDKPRGVVVETNSDGSSWLAWLTKEDWFNYTFYCSETAKYKLEITYNGAPNGSSFIDIDAKYHSNVAFENVGWEHANRRTITIDNIDIAKGYHYLKFTSATDINLYQFKFIKTADSPLGIIPSCKNKNTFEGVPANDCEVKFTGDDDSNNYAEYRKQDGWMYLLTKELDQTKKYSCVNQKHGDAKITRSFNKIDETARQNNWYSIVFPFDVDAKVLLSAKTNEGKQLFDRAATLDNKSFNSTGYPNAHFTYLNGVPFLAKVKNPDTTQPGAGPINPDTGRNDTDENPEFVYDESNNYIPAGDEKIEAGTPFIVRTRNINSNNSNVYNIEDLHIYPSNDKDASTILDSRLEKENSYYTFNGNLYDAKLSIKSDNKSYWFLSGKYYYGGNTDDDWIYAYRSYFKAKNETGFALMMKLFFGETPTGVDAISTDNTVNGNIYNLNGQLVRKNAKSTEGLSQGIYIVNGKRVVIK